MTTTDRPEAAAAQPGDLVATEPVPLRVAISELYASGMDFRDVAMALFGSDVPNPGPGRREEVCSDLEAVSPDAEREAGL